MKIFGIGTEVKVQSNDEDEDYIDPKHFKSPLAMFTYVVGKKLKEKNNNIGASETRKLAQKLWKSRTPIDKMYWEQKATKAKQYHLQKLDLKRLAKKARHKFKQKPHKVVVVVKETYEKTKK